MIAKLEGILSTALQNMGQMQTPTNNGGNN